MLHGRRWTLTLLAFVLGGLSYIGSPAAQTANSDRSAKLSHNFGLRIEPGLAIPLSKPQSDRFNLGGGQTVKGYYNLTRWLDIGPSVSFSDFSAADGVTRSGTAWDFGAGLRAKGPVTGSKGIAMLPWVDSDALYVRTGELDRFGFDAGVGLGFAFGKNRSFRLGPFVRYRHILQPERAGFDNRDAKLLHAGVSLEFGAPLMRSKSKKKAQAAPKTEPAEQKECEPCPVPKPAKAEEQPDRDGDGFPDAYDRCPDVAGPKEHYGCPDYDKIEVTPNKIDLKERVLFDWDKANIKEESHEILDELASVLKRNDGFEVRVEGHTDATGLESYNQTLSEQRAQAVVDYLVDQGVDEERFIVRGYSSSRPADTNLTDAGRQKNRRVEFIIDLQIMDFDRNNRSDQ